MTYLGLVTIGMALVLLVWVLIDALYQPDRPAGLGQHDRDRAVHGSVQLFCLGIIGEYIRLIFLETKGRPDVHRRDRDHALGDAAEAGGKPAPPAISDRSRRT